MNNWTIEKGRNRIDKLIELAQGIPHEQVEIYSHWARYLCVIVVGFLETSVNELYSNYPEGKSAKEVVNFVQKNAKLYRGPEIANISHLAAKFSQIWAEEILGMDQEVKLAVNSLVGERHNIAHGRDSAITMHRLREYYPKVIDVLELIEGQLNE